ncbi:RTA1-domain-containing protein [Parathielavia appendiculata]|uniref:RTA1-domain-containing protein n=1 Tax=Parathielavia appendiculata TaxID=2587402 RepID=A0AAN6Z0H5_9PEZI|nr:RTA1-domain-containing protein [Parathielavia appendiculata]
MADNEKAFADFKFYHYDPSLAANIVFIVLFAIVAIGHVWLLVHKRVWYFIPFVIGCIFEAVGYVGRAISATETPKWTLKPYIIQTLLILLGPALLAASIYMILARLIRLLGAEKYALIRPNWMTKVFVTGDVLSFFAQGGGGGLMAQAKSKQDQQRGEYIILGGLAIQVLFFGFFMVTAVAFHVRISSNPTPKSYSVTGPWRQHVVALYISSVLIMVRSVFRMIEFGMGSDSVLMSNEAYLLALDGALMFIVAVVFLWSHPSRALRGYKDSSMLPVDSVESGRNTAESLQMLSVHLPQTVQVPSSQQSKYESDSSVAPGTTGPRTGYGYEMPAGRYSNSYGG